SSCLRTRRWTLKVCGTAIPAQITEIILPSGGRFTAGPRLPMPPTFDALRIVSLGSGFAWWAVWIGPAIRTHLASRLERALAATAFFLGGWAFLDAVYPAFAGVSPTPDVVFIGLRVTLLSFATLALLLTTKWMARRPSHYDARLVLPLIGSLRLVLREPPSRAGSPARGIGNPGTRHRDLHVLPDRRAPRRAGVEPEPSDRSGAARRPPRRRRELRGNERPAVAGVRGHGDAVRGTRNRRGPRGIRHRRGGLRRARVRRAPGRAHPGPEGL